MKTTDFTKSIEELENDRWTLDNNITPLIKKCYELRRKNLRDLSPKDLRLLISQSIGLEYTIPLAINIVENDIFIESEYYPGDLLFALLSKNSIFWKKNQEDRLHLNDIVSKANLESLDATDEIKNDLFYSFENFKKI